MNDLMTKSFLSYVELKKQAMKDLESETDIEMGRLGPTDEANLAHFFDEVGATKADMEEITNLLLDLQDLNEETKSTHSAKVLRGLRDRMDSNMVAVLCKAKIIKARLVALDRSNIANRSISTSYREGSPVDRIRISVTGSLRTKLRDIMAEFQSLREEIIADYKEGLRRRYFSATGEIPREEVIEKMVSGGGGQLKVLEGKIELNLENQERQEAVKEIQRSLTELHQVFLDMAVLVETQGKEMENIEQNVASAATMISGGTNRLVYANQMKRKGRSWVYWVWALIVIVLVVCLISTLTS